MPAVVQALLVGIGEYKFVSLLWRSFYNEQVQKVRFSQIDPLHCIIPPCHQRDPYPFKEIQEASPKNKHPPHPQYSQVSVLTEMFKVS